MTPLVPILVYAVIYVMSVVLLVYPIFLWVEHTRTSRDYRDYVIVWRMAWVWPFVLLTMALATVCDVGAWGYAWCRRYPRRMAEFIWGQDLPEHTP